MSRYLAEKTAFEMISNTYHLKDYRDERIMLAAMLALDRDTFLKTLNSPKMEAMTQLYTGTMSPSHIRSLKNAVISLTTSISHLAVDSGIDAKLSFALRAYYIHYQEQLTKTSALRKLVRDILLHYYDLIQNQKQKAHSKPITLALHYIDRNLYTSCPVPALAAYVGLEPHYFSTLFSKQVGLSPGRYILQRKLDEAYTLLSEHGTSVTSVAESLGFCDTSHFSRQFKKAFGYPPSALLRMKVPAASQKSSSTFPTLN